MATEDIPPNNQVILPSLIGLSAGILLFSVLRSIWVLVAMLAVGGVLSARLFRWE